MGYYPFFQSLPINGAHEGITQLTILIKKHFVQGHSFFHFMVMSIAYLLIAIFFIKKSVFPLRIEIRILIKISNVKKR